MAVLDFTRYTTPDLKYSAALVVLTAAGRYESAGVYRIRKGMATTAAKLWTITFAPGTPSGEGTEVQVGRHRTLEGAKKAAALDADRRIAEARNAPQEAAQPQEPGVLARLSSTITVEESPHGLQVVREHYQGDRIITLRPEAEDALLALLLARKGVRLVP